MADDDRCVMMRAERGAPDTLVIGTAERSAGGGLPWAAPHFVTFISALTTEPLAGSCGGVEYTGASRPGSPWFLAPRTSVDAPILRVQQALGRDERDLLDAGVDALVATRTSTVEYARALAGWDIYPLSWDRVYVFLTAGEAADVASPALAGSLARDAVQAGARVAEPPFAWQSGECPMPTPRHRPGSRSPRVVYPVDDYVARAIAERLVALAGGSDVDRAELRAFGALGDIRGAAAVPLDVAGMTTALESGADLGYVLPLPRAASCGSPGARWSGFYNIIPLVDTRAHLIVRAGVVSLGRDAGGRVRILPGSEPLR
jgi:hypothetical protein